MLYEFEIREGLKEWKSWDGFKYLGECWFCGWPCL